MMNIEEFEQQYPQYAYIFGQEKIMGRFGWEIADTIHQPPVTDMVLLAELPEELEPDHENKLAGLPHPTKRNRTLTHYQCARCNRLLRNDFFSQNRGSGVCHCKACGGNSQVREKKMMKQEKEAKRLSNQLKYLGKKQIATLNRRAIYDAIAPQCCTCGQQNQLVIEMHHVGTKNDNIGKLVSAFVLSPTKRNAERLATELSLCVPLCRNCHRLVHVGQLEVPDGCQTVTITARQLLDAVTTVLQSTSKSPTASPTAGAPNSSNSSNV